MRELNPTLREVAVLQEATEMVLSSMDAEAVLHHMLLVARNHFGVSSCSILLVDPEKDELYIHTHNGFDDPGLLGRRYKIGRDGLSGHVASTKTPLYVPDVSKEPRYISARPEVRSELALPLVVRDEVLGVLTLSSDQEDYFADEMIGLLALFAGQAAVALENARLYSTERRRMRQIEFVNLIARSATTAHDLEQLMATLAELISDTFEDSQVSILLRDAGGSFVLRAHAGGEVPSGEQFQGSLRHGILSEALAARMNVGVANTHEKIKASPSWSRCLPESACEVGVPLMALGETLGVIVLSHKKVNAFSGEDRSIAQAAADVGATAIRNVQLSEELLRLANTDSLTGVFNQRYFHVAVSQEVTRARRFGKPFSIVMFDIRRFRLLNQDAGFDAGDELLRGVAHLLRSTVRAIDTICRYAGDRFAIVLPETTDERVRSFQAKIERGLAELPFSPTAPQRMTAVFAEVQYPQDGANELELIRHLMNRLEAAKSDAKGASA